MSLTLTPISANEEPLHIGIAFPDFYKINVSATSCKPIGLVGINYTGIVTVWAPKKEVNLTNRYMLIDCFHKDEKELDTDKVFIFNNIDCYRLPSHRLNLSDELNETSLSKGEYKNFSFTIFFYEAGLYDFRWKESGEPRDIDTVRIISIVSPIEYEQLTKQAEVLDAEKKSVEASKKIALFTIILAGVTGVLAFGTFLMVWYSAINLKHAAFVYLTQLLQDEDIRQARKVVIDRLSQKDYRQWLDVEKDDAEKVIYTYDIAGIMLSKRSIDIHLLQRWRDSIIKCWEVLQPMVEDYRQKRGKDWTKDYEKLYKKLKSG